MSWQNLQNIPTKSYKCGYCGQTIASEKGYFTATTPKSLIYICHNCNKPTHFDGAGKQTPGPFTEARFRM